MYVDQTRPDLIGPREAAALLGVGKSRLRQLDGEGLPHLRVEHARVYVRSDVLEFAAARNRRPDQRRRCRSAIQLHEIAGHLATLDEPSLALALATLPEHEREDVAQRVAALKIARGVA